MSVNVNHFSMSATLEMLRQQHQQQQNTLNVAVSTVKTALQTQAETHEVNTPAVQVQTEQQPTNTTWSRVNTSVNTAPLSKIIAEQKVQKFFDESGVEKTDSRVNLASKFFIENPRKELTVFKLEALETPAKDKKLHLAPVSTGGIASLQTAYGAVTPILSWSSKRMSQLMNWRNTESQAQSSKVRTIVNIAKKAVTEVALPFITVSSIVESLATKLLSLGARVIKRDATHLNAVHSSAVLTIFWSATTLYHNVKEKTLVADESVIRDTARKNYIKV